MAGKSRFTRLDAFTKTVEDARIRTTSGGIVTITSLIVIFWLVWGEWADYRRVVVRPELVVDKGRGTFFVYILGRVDLDCGSQLGARRRRAMLDKRKTTWGTRGE